MQLLVPRRGVAHAVGGDDGKAEPQRHTNERAMAVLFLAQPMPLQLHVEPPGKERAEALERAASRPPSLSARATGPSGPPVRQCSPGACSSTCSHVTLVSPFGLPNAPAVISRHRFL